MAFAPDQLLVAVKAAHAAHQRLDRLAIDDRGARGRIAPGMQARQFAQVRMDLDPGAVAAPLPKIVIHRLPGTVLAGQIAPRHPGTARAQHVKDTIGNLAHV